MPKSRAFSASVSHLQRRFRIVDAEAAVGGRHVVVDDGERLLRRAHLAAGDAQALEGLRARHLVHEVAVDIEEAGAVGLARRPDGRPRSCRKGFSVSWLVSLCKRVRVCGSGARGALSGEAANRRKRRAGRRNAPAGAHDRRSRRRRSSNGHSCRARGGTVWPGWKSWPVYNSGAPPPQLRRFTGPESMSERLRMIPR